MKILIVEDEPSLRELIQCSLEKERYVVETASDFNSALRKVEDYDYDCILLDIMLPDGSGLDLLERLKALHKRENVIIISAKDSLEDKVLGLELGSDDYLPKPFHLVELNARIKSVIRRHQHDGEIDIRQGNVRIEPDKYRVFVNDQEVELNRKEYDILLYFINRPGRLINKNTLAESVWGDHIDQVDNFDFIYAQNKKRKRILSMKLIYYIILRITLALTFILTVWAIFFYVTMIDEVNDEVDDALEDYSETIIIRALAGEELPSKTNGSNNQYYMMEVSKEYAESREDIQYKDSMVYIEEKEETEPARILTTIFKDDEGRYHELTVSTPSIEKDDM